MRGATIYCKRLRAESSELSVTKRAKRDEIVRQDTQLETAYVLRLQQESADLVVETTLSDEKGQAEYRMVFTKAS